MSEIRVPQSAMVIIAHPDDAEFMVAGTAAAWVKAGCQVTYVLCTDGNAGSHVPGMTKERLAAIRRDEQRAACARLGVQQVVFLGYDDGLLMPTLELRRDLVRVIRQFKPQMVFCSDPTVVFAGRGYINHPDHRAAGQAALDAIAPAAAMPLIWPQVGEPHQVEEIWVTGRFEADTFVDIGTTIGLKIAALKEHKSQMEDWDPTEMIKEWAAETGKDAGMAYAEGFRVYELH